MVKSNERIAYIDVFKGIGIILMIMGHIGFGTRFDVFIHAFHMPMFFFASGYLYRNKQMSIKDFVSKKARALLLPYLVFGILHLGFVFFVYKDINASYLFHLFFDNTDGLPIAGALWFLTALFFTNVIYYFINRYIKSVVLVNIVVVVIAVFGNICSFILPFKMPFALSAAFVGVGLFHIGTLFRNHKDNIVIHRLLNLGLFFTVLLLCLTTVLIFVNGSVNMRTGNYSFVPLFWINSIFAIVLLLNISKMINKVFCDRLIHKWITDIGKNSINYLCLNQIVLVYIGYYSGGELYIKLLILAETIFILFFIGEIIAKTKLSIIIGKRPKG